MVDQPLQHFHGGLVLKHHKRMSCSEPFIRAPLPEYVDISLRLNRGHIAQPIVEVGEYVLKGQLIAQPVSPRGSFVHASVSGHIAHIREQPTASPDADKAPVIRIKADGKQQCVERKSHGFDSNTAPDEIAKLLQRYGIIGMGGAGFPTHLKYNRDKSADTLIINGAECEPYISCDERLMLDFTRDIVRGTRWLIQVAQAQHAIIAIEDNMGGVRKLLETHIKQEALDTLISVVKVPTIYPTGGEKQLIKVLTGKEVPSGGIPSDIGLIMQNVATAKAVYDAIETGQPIEERLVTVTGDEVAKPRNYMAPIGTPIQHLLKIADARMDEIDKLIIGGPMMGYAMPNEHIGIDRTTNCILTLNEKSTRKKSPEMPCIRCGDCVKVCPQELLPQQLFWYIDGGDLEQANNHHVFDCIECGACSWVCPSQINLVDFYRYAKSELEYLSYKNNKSQSAKSRFEEREKRLAQQKAERQERRQRQAQRLKDKKQAKKEISAVLDRIKSKQEER